ncbi:carbohydrate ABC transporter permease [Paenibacillus hemerocallicola]|uniref:Carbohydrate ABC transporter permease n=1 Tax=Paenibacillus hemerocallicola TaxID=1172614 RepID=A0A5C4TD33_9BACL|nr:carbohydrate ABC transporter permease [Paenibacillus hemerocallicola]TNJ66984.1 carbohydrate ABC transporter permease [Paenibacillus hemerocallicola]
MPIYKSERIFHVINNLFFIATGALMLAPMIHVLALSLSGTEFVNANRVYLWPKGWNLNVYKEIFGQASLWRAMGVSVYITVTGTLFSLFFTSTMAYALSRPNMPGRRLILKVVVVTFIFSAPLIPHFMIVDFLRMTDTLWALIIPGAIGAFGVIIMKTFFQGISSELFDAGSIDGCSEFGIYGKIAVPLSLPVFATIGLFHAVGQWNAYFGALIFIRSKELYPIQIVLRGLIVREDSAEFSHMNELNITPETMKAGIIVFATLPIVLLYPFLQKYFVKGAMVGSLKE